MKHISSTADKSGFSLIEVMIIVMVIGMLTTLAMPAWQRARQTARKSICQDNLRILNGSAAQYLFVHPQISDLTPGNLTEFLLDEKVPLCPSGGEYAFQINPHLVPVCSWGDTLDHIME